MPLACAGTPAEEAETSLFVEPLRWMSGALQPGEDRVVSGKLSCPGCAAVRGLVEHCHAHMESGKPYSIECLMFELCAYLCACEVGKVGAIHLHLLITCFGPHIPLNLYTLGGIKGCKWAAKLRACKTRCSAPAAPVACLQHSQALAWAHPARGARRCGARLGMFNWAGAQSSSGSWVTPAFQLHRSRLDQEAPRAAAAALPVRASRPLLGPGRAGAAPGPGPGLGPGSVPGAQGHLPAAQGPLGTKSGTAANGLSEGRHQAGAEGGDNAAWARRAEEHVGGASGIEAGQGPAKDGTGDGSVVHAVQGLTLAALSNTAGQDDPSAGHTPAPDRTL